MARGTTGLPGQDAQDDFNRARRRRLLAQLAGRLRREPADFDVILPFDEVVSALGRTGERRLGLHSVELDAIVGTVDRSKEFDRHFRPISTRTRERWERIAAAQRRGEPMPPISLYEVGGMYFVEDGHHRVSVARALGQSHIDAYVTEVTTSVGASSGLRVGDLALKGHERLFFERVPLPPKARGRIRLSDPLGFDALAEGVEAWGFRAMQERGRFMTRAEVAEAWFADEYVPVSAMLEEAGLAADGTETDAYMTVAAERYRLLRTHSWDDDVVAALADRLAPRRR